ncbi:MAG: aminotransferase class I/II-fold pyridoxal phosphate-dependent enzyme [Pirellulales bacterium]|nr:aminotransferase class I/II-fold pyridoxal phosphate-dependent enzyme [Pirellulales bacterium]
MKRNDENPASASPRRDFLKTTGAAAAGLYLAGAGSSAAGQKTPGKSETLAVAGGSPTVTYPKEKQRAVFRWPQYGQSEKEVVRAVLDGSQRNFYNALARLEAQWREYNEVPFAKSHMNGSSALLSMYFALDLPPGSEVMVPSYTFFSTVTSLRFFGLVPVFIDINPRTATLDVEDARKKMNPKVRAIVPMHSWGLPCEMDHVCDFAKEHDLIVLEDAAHAHGASMQGKKMGTWGRMGIFSYQATKPLPGIEGGMGTYQNREDYERATVLGHYEAVSGNAPASGNSGIAPDSPYRKYEGTGLGMKLRMHPLAAALILKQLEKLDEQNRIINSQVRKINDRICQLPGLSEPVCREDQERVYYSGNLIFFDEAKAGISRATAVRALQAEGVGLSVWEYPENHKYALYSEPKWWHHPIDVPKVLPGCEEVNSRAINLALFRQEAPEMVDQYIAAFEKVWAHRKELA